MSDTNTPQIEASVEIAGQKFALVPNTITGRTVKGEKKPDTLYFSVGTPDVGAVKRLLGALVDGAEKVKAGSAVELVNGLLKDSYRQATVDATKDGDDFEPATFVTSLVTADRPRSHGEKLSDLRQQAADLANELLFLYETATKCGQNDAAIAKETDGLVKSATALTQMRVAKTEKRRNIIKLIEEKEAASAKRKAEADAKKAAAPTPASKAPVEPNVAH